MIDWARDAKGDLIIDWREQDGPPVKPPTRRGFGSTIIEHSIPHDLNGEVALDYRPEGLPSSHPHPRPLRHHRGRHRRADPAAPRRHAGCAPERMLVLEDNMIIALDLEDMLTRLGVQHVTVASSVDQAMDALAEGLPPFAILDVNLGQETSFPIAEVLQARPACPSPSAPASADSAAFPERFKDAPVLQKPYSAESVAALF
ncbi:hypothetical protein ACRAWD_07605 [Caulobacter segnis]